MFKLLHGFQNIVVKLHHRARHQFFYISAGFGEALADHALLHCLHPICRFVFTHPRKAQLKILFRHKFIFSRQRAADTAAAARAAFHIINVRHFIHGNLLQHVIHVFYAMHRQTFFHAYGRKLAAVTAPAHAVGRSRGYFFAFFNAADRTHQPAVNFRNGNAAGELRMHYVYRLADIGVFRRAGSQKPYANLRFFKPKPLHSFFFYINGSSLHRRQNRHYLFNKFRELNLNQAQHRRAGTGN